MKCFRLRRQNRKNGLMFKERGNKAKSAWVMPPHFPHLPLIQPANGHAVLHQSVELNSDLHDIRLYQWPHFYVYKASWIIIPSDHWKLFKNIYSVKYLDQIHLFFPKWALTCNVKIDIQAKNVNFHISSHIDNRYTHHFSLLSSLIRCKTFLPNDLWPHMNLDITFKPYLV